MVKKQETTTYCTTDGAKFTDPQAAERHEAIVTAMHAYQAARRNFGDMLAESFRTADGVPFEFGIFRDYYYVTPGWDGVPMIHTVNFNCGNWEYQLDEYHETGRFSLATIDRGDNNRRTEYKIADIYRHKANAERALVETMRAWVKGKQDDLAELEAKVGTPNA